MVVLDLGTCPSDSVWVYDMNFENVVLITAAMCWFLVWVLNSFVMDFHMNFD